jgi:hypothetical protein
MSTITNTELNIMVRIASVCYIDVKLGSDFLPQEN